MLQYEYRGLLLDDPFTDPGRVIATKLSSPESILLLDKNQLQAFCFTSFDYG